MAEDASPEAPIYKKVQFSETATKLFFITCDEGWRQSIVCQGMYEWAADWLLTVLERRPFAPDYSEEIDDHELRLQRPHGLPAGGRCRPER